MEPDLDHYEAALEPERRRVLDEQALAHLLSPECDDRRFARWFLRLSAHSVCLARYEGWWLPNAGRRHGRREIRPFDTTPYARQQAAHLERVLSDAARAAARWWCDRYGEQPDVEALLDAPPPAGAEFCVRLHENVTNGPAPLCALAVTYEVGLFLVSVRPALRANCRRVFGTDPGPCGALAEEGAALVDRVASVRERLASFLADQPAALGPATGTGITALASFAVFLTECWDLARADLDVDRNAT